MFHHHQRRVGPEILRVASSQTSFFPYFFMRYEYIYWSGSLDLLSLVVKHWIIAWKLARRVIVAANNGPFSSLSSLPSLSRWIPFAICTQFANFIKFRLFNCTPQIYYIWEEANGRRSVKCDTNEWHQRWGRYMYRASWQWVCESAPAWAWFLIFMLSNQILHREKRKRAREWENEEKEFRSIKYWITRIIFEGAKIIHRCQLPDTIFLLL